MEINKNKGLTDLQQFRYELLQWCGTVKEAKEAENYIFGKISIKGQDLCFTDRDELKLFRSWKKNQMKTLTDGVYFVVEGKDPIKFSGEVSIPDGEHIEAVGLVMGEFSIKIALQDEAEGKRITLTTKANGNDRKDDAPYYIESYEDAIAEMDGDISTDHLKNILNPAIKLQQGWYIPSLGELYRIFINLKEINAALEFIGETPLYRGYYWTSTEGSAARAWFLLLSDGSTSRWYTKASLTFRVRAVSAFINA